MQPLVFQKQCRLGKLTDELITAIPALAPVPAPSVPGLPPENMAVFTVAGNTTTTTVTCPDTTNATTVGTVVAAHDASTPSPVEVLQAQALANQATLTQKATAALTANTTFLNLATPTNAQVLAQVQMLTRENSALIRLALNLFDTTAGT